MHGHCDFTNYIPGGSQVKITKIIPPMVEVQRKVLASAAGKAGRAISGVGHTLGLLEKVAKNVKIIHPAIAPALRFLGSLLGGIAGKVITCLKYI